MRHHDHVTAVHREIADDLRTAIRSGQLQPGSPLPSMSALAEQYGVTKPTAGVALRTLAAEGWIVVQHGKVSVVADTQPSATPTLADLARRVEVLEELHSSDTPSHQHP